MRRRVSNETREFRHDMEKFRARFERLLRMWRACNETWRVHEVRLIEESFSTDLMQDQRIELELTPDEIVLRLYVREGDEYGTLTLEHVVTFQSYVDEIHRVTSGHTVPEYDFVVFRVLFDRIETRLERLIRGLTAISFVEVL